MTNLIPKTFLMITILMASCSGDDSESFINLNISSSANADEGSSYTNSKTDIHISYSELPNPGNAGDLRDAISYLDVNNDGFTDIFMATGTYLSFEEFNCLLTINDGSNRFISSTAEFSGNMPKATHARKSIVADFNGDGLEDIFVFDTGFDNHPFPGSNPKLIIQNSAGTFSWSKLTDQTGFHHGGAAADIDNDGDIDVFVGGFDPFFYINDGNANFTLVNDLFDNSIAKVFTAELIDIDQDGYVDLMVGAHERDGDKTTIFWGNSTGSYTQNLATEIPVVQYFGAILDFDAEDIDNDGDRDIVINRTRDGDDGGGLTFYQGRYIQLLLHDGNRNFTDQTSESIDDFGGANDFWVRWIRIQDFDNDGDLDIFSDNTDDNLIYINDGNAFFTKK